MLLLAVPLLLHCGQIGTSPDRFEIVYDKKNRTYALKFFNMGDTAMRMKVEASDWTLVNDSVKELPPTPQSLSQWLLFSPARFTVAAHDEQVVRFAIRPRVKPEPGEHRAMLWLSQIPETKAPTGKMTALVRSGTAIYLYVPPVQAQAHIDELNASVADGSIILHLAISNHGNRHDRPKGKVSIWHFDTPLSDQEKERLTREMRQDTKAKGLVAVETLTSMPILGGQSIVRTQRLKTLPPGRYRIVVAGRFLSGDKFSFHRTVTVSDTKR